MRKAQHSMAAGRFQTTLVPPAASRCHDCPQHCAMLIKVYDGAYSERYADCEFDKMAPALALATIGLDIQVV